MPNQGMASYLDVVAGTEGNKEFLLYTRRSELEQATLVPNP